MRSLTIFIFTLLLAAGCSDAADTGSKQATSSEPAAQSPPATNRGGTITVGKETWTISPMRQCSIYPGGIVNIWGYAADDPELEIVIDYGGPNQVRIGNDGPNVVWQAERDTLEIQIDGQRVLGTATFSRYAGGTKETARGSIEVNC